MLLSANNSLYDPAIGIKYKIKKNNTTLSKIDFGVGKRSLVESGVLVLKYNLVLPKNMVQ